MQTPENDLKPFDSASTEPYVVVNGHIAAAFRTENLPVIQSAWNTLQGIAGATALGGQIETRFDTAFKGEPLNTTEREHYEELREQQRQLRARQESFGLSGREIEVIESIAQGHNNAKVASKLFISPSTVRSHVKRINEKLGTTDRAGILATYYCLIEKPEDSSNM